jgi:hypothetical protein
MSKRKRTPQVIPSNIPYLINQQMQSLNSHITPTEVRVNTVAEFKKIYNEQFETYEDVLIYFAYMYESRIFQLAKSKDRYMIGINKAAASVQTYQSLLENVDKANQN